MRLCDAVSVTGEFKAELFLEPNMEDVEMGEIKVLKSAGSVTLRCIGGREVEYGAKPAGTRVFDTALR